MIMIEKSRSRIVKCIELTILRWARIGFWVSISVEIQKCV